MIYQLAEMAEQLAALLEAENAALGRLDLPGAAAMLDRKRLAIEAFTVAQRALDSTLMDAATQARVTAAARRLSALAGQNRKLLERGIIVQERVIGVVARAVPRAITAGAAGYRAGGAPSRSSRALPIALSAHA